MTPEHMNAIQTLLEEGRDLQETLRGVETAGGDKWTGVALQYHLADGTWFGASGIIDGRVAPKVQEAVIAVLKAELAIWHDRMQVVAGGEPDPMPEVDGD